MADGRLGPLATDSEEVRAVDNTLTLAIHGKVSLEVYAAEIQHFQRLVEALTRETAPGANVRWVIDELHAGSATTTVRAEGDLQAAAPIGPAYLDLGRALAASEIAAYPRSIRDEALSLVGILNGEVDFIRFETAEADVAVMALPAVTAVSAAGQGITPPAFGGVQGRVQTLTNRRGLRFTIYDTLFDRAVSCYLAEGQEDVMRDAWGRLAVVEGLVSRDPISGRPLAVRDVSRVTIVHEAAPDGYLRARGAISWRPDDPPPEVLIRRVRDAA